MMKNIETKSLKSFSSERYFRILDYKLSHLHLLVRSGQSRQRHWSYTIDLVFSGVEHIAIPTSFWGLDMTIANERLDEFKEILGVNYALGHSMKLFTIETNHHPPGFICSARDS